MRYHLILDHHLADKKMIEKIAKFTHVQISNIFNIPELISHDFYDIVVLSDCDQHTIDSIRQSQGAKYVAMIMITQKNEKYNHIDYVLKHPFTLSAFKTAIKHVKEIMDSICVFNPINAIKQTLISRDVETKSHLERVPILCDMICKLLLKEKSSPYYFDERFKREVVLFSSIHDLGKIGIPDELLKCTDAYDEHKHEMMQTHTTLGARFYQQAMKDYTSQYSLIGYNIIKYHHERFDGLGYPCGLNGFDIPLEARIVCIVDVIDAMFSKRRYKEPFSSDKVYEYLKEQVGKHFDPYIAKITIKHFARIERIYQLE